MSVSEIATRKATGRVNAPLECWGYTNYPRYYTYRFHTYRNCPNRMYLDVTEREKWSIEEYNKNNSFMGCNRGFQVNQDGRGLTSSTIMLSMFVYHRMSYTNLGMSGGSYL